MIRLSLVVVLLAASPCAFAQQNVSLANQSTQGSSPAHPSAQDPAQQDPGKPSAPEPKTPQDTPQATAPAAKSPQPAEAKQGDQGPAVPSSEQQPKRILGIMPNYRAVSAGAIPPPPTAKQALVIATKNSFDYSAFVFVGLTSLIAKGTDAHPQLGKGPDGYWNYYWRGFVDKTDGNYLVLFALPTLLHQDERYYAMGHSGRVWKRMAYSASRILITPDYHGHNTFNASEVFGRAMAQGISLSYYPSHDRTGGALAVKYGYAMLRDAATQMFREFWPDIAVHLLHRHP